MKIETQGIKYLGAKTKILPLIMKNIEKIKPKKVFDGFAGTTRVGQMVAKSNIEVISNDLAEWSRVFGECYLQNKENPKYYDEIIKYLNSLKPKKGWFSENYGAEEYSEKKAVWQIHNTMKLDTIREEIEILGLTKQEKSVILTSLIMALNEVDNTLGHFTGFLKKWSKRSYKEMELKVPKIWINEKDNIVLQENIMEILEKIEVDLAYLDPPYGSDNDKMPSSRVRYNSYYNIWKTIILNDKPKLFGKVGRREDSRDKNISIFEEYKKENNKYLAEIGIEKMIEKIKAKYILFSYNNKGRVPIEKIINIFNKNGEILNIDIINYNKNIMSKMTTKKEWIHEIKKQNREYLILLKK
jgi:adenine-specific DNA-methyltransferase